MEKERICTEHGLPNCCGKPRPEDGSEKGCCEKCYESHDGVAVECGDEDCPCHHPKAEKECCAYCRDGRIERTFGACVCKCHHPKAEKESWEWLLEEIKSPVVRDFARGIVQHALASYRARLKKILEGKIHELAHETMDLCANSQNFKVKTIRRLTDLITAIDNE